MKLSYNWLKDYLDFDLTPQQVADAITSIGIEVDSVEQQEEIPGGLEGVVVAKVIECGPHPDSDHLHITKVDDGTAEPLTVVCGAPNVAAGQKVLFARLGSVLPGDFKIKKSKIELWTLMTLREKEELQFLVRMHHSCTRALKSMLLTHQDTLTLVAKLKES